MEPQDEWSFSREAKEWPSWAKVSTWCIAIAITVAIAVVAVSAIQSGLFEKLLSSFLR